ncbi:MAG: glycosyltransferase family 4 protein [bacterium]|nr:glycosyltransferase family 4 protein [bacterium]
MQNHLIYIANARIPTEKAHGLAVMKLCEAFAKEGLAVTLLTADRHNPVQDDPFSYYDITQKFQIERLPVWDTIRFWWLGPVGFWIESISFTISLVMRLRRLRRTLVPETTILFSHEHLPLLAGSFVYPLAFYDMHDFPVRGRLLYRLLFSRLRGIVTTNQWKKNELQKRFRVSPERLFAFPNGVDVGTFSLPVSRIEARQKLNLPRDKKIVLYTGHLYSWKGVDTLLTASRVLPHDMVLYIVGGTDRDITKRKAQSAKQGLRNIIFTGHKPHREIPLWLRAADVLVIPNTAKEEISLHFTSPMKLFEYMASGTPIVASRIPSIEAVVDEQSVWFFEADNPASCARAIITASGEPNRKKTEHAQTLVQTYTWDARAREILQFIATRRIS